MSPLRRPLVLIAVVYCLGLILAANFQWSAPILLAAASAALVVAALAVASGWRQSVTALLVSALLIGGLGYATLSKPASDDISRLVPRTASVTGVIVADPEVDENDTVFTLRVERAAARGKLRPVSGMLRVVAEAAPALKRGDRVRFTGRIARPHGATNPGQASARERLARKGVYAQTFLAAQLPLRVLSHGHLGLFERASVATRSALMGSIRAGMPGPYRREFATLMGSLIFGLRSCPLPRVIEDSFRRSGIIHILVVSGSQVSLLFVLVFLPGWMARLRRRVKGQSEVGTLRALPAKLAIPFALLALGWYAFLTEGGQSVWRAAIMAGVAGLGMMLEQTPRVAERHSLEADRLTLLALAALVILAFNPTSLFDPGFQLSFAAVWGLICLAPRFRRALSFVPAWAALPVATTCGAQLATAPVLAWHFHSVPVIGFAANLVAIPLAAALLSLGLVTSLIGLLLVPLAQALNWISWGLLWVLVQSCHWFAQLPNAMIPIGVGSPLPVAAYVGALMAIGGGDRTERSRLPRERLLLIVLLVLALGVWWWAVRGFNRSLEITFFDVGEGDSILIRAPSGRSVLIDGGSRAGMQPGAPDVGERVIVPGLLVRGVRHLNAIILTHPDADHVDGLDTIVEQVGADVILDPRLSHPSLSYRRFLSAARRHRISIRRARRGQVVNLGGGVKLQVLSPQWPLLSDTESDLNNNSVVLRLSDGRVSVLFMADVEREGEQQILSHDGDLASTVIKVGHHGSADTTSDWLLREVRPKAAIISVGEGNPFGHPSEGVLHRLAAHHVRVLRTDVDGSITLNTDGQSYTLSSLRP